MRRRLLAVMIAACLLITMAVPAMAEPTPNYGTVTIADPASTGSFEFGASYTAATVEANKGKMLNFTSTFTPEVGSYNGNVLFQFTITASDGANVQAWAKDAFNNWYDLAATGYWGPTGGFPYPSVLATTPIYVAVDKPCTLTFNGGLKSGDGNTTLIQMAEKTYTIAANTKTVTFNSNGGSAVAAATVNVGLPVSEPTIPTKANNIFVGWYTDGTTMDDTTRYDFTKPVTADMTLYAYWKAIDDNSVEIKDPVVGSGAPDLDVGNAADIAPKVPLTEDEQKALAAAGGKLQVDFEINVISPNETPDSSTVNGALQSGQRVLAYLSIDMTKTIGGNTSSITNLNGPIRLTIDIPVNLRGQSSYQIVRVHTKPDGTKETTILKDLDNNPNTITIETDRFSTYALTNAPVVYNNNDDDDDDEKSYTYQEPTNPSTGDATPIAGMVVLAAGCAFVIGTILKTKKVR